MWLVTTLNLLAVGALLLGPVVITMLTARSLFPNYWWLAHVENKDIYEYDGVYFIGGRATRQQSRLTRLVFGLDEKMRRWHLVFGLLAVSLIVPHLMAGYTSWRYAEALAPNRPVLQESLHSSLLSALPIMQGWNRPWSADGSLAGEVKKELRDALKSNRQEPSQWYRIAQLRMLGAFRPRKGTAEPFLYSPGDRILFNRGEGAESAASLKRILDQPEAKRKGWTRGALALTGFFHFSDQNPGLALEFFQRALATVEQTDHTGEYKKGTAEPFLYSPGDRILFNRGEGAESAASLKRILDQPEAKRKGWTRGALALTGFFHFSDQNPGLALEFFQRALATVEQTDHTGISKHMIVLLTAQAALVARQPSQAEMLLEKLLTEDELPDGTYARAMEHFAGALHLQGRTETVNDLLGKALKTYKKLKDRAGIARVHLRLAALALEQGRTRDASRALSLAASLANGLDDGFTLNMVGVLSQYFPRVL